MAGRRRPLPIFRSMCIVGLAMLLLAFVFRLVDLQPPIATISFVAGAGLLVVGGLGWMISGFGL